MYTFTTTSGSTYLVSDGRISRLSGSPIFDRYTGEPTDLLVDATPFRWLRQPIVGQSAKFVLKDEDRTTLTTSCVTAVDRELVLV